MYDLRSDQCSDSSLYNTFCSPFTTKELTTAISKHSISTASGPDLIAYPLLKAQPNNIFSPATPSHRLQLEQNLLFCKKGFFPRPRTLKVAGKKGSSRDPEFPNSQSPKTLPVSTLPTSAHTSLNKLLGSLVVLSVTSWTIYARTNDQTHPSITLSALPSPPMNLQLLFPNTHFHCLRPQPHSLSSTNRSAQQHLLSIYN